MAYTKTVWSDRVVQFIRRYTDELGATKTFTPSEGTVTNAGTAVSAALMNKIEQGIYDAQNTADGAIAKSLLTAQGDIIYATGANTPERLAKGTAGQVLKMNSGATAPEWVSLNNLITKVTETYRDKAGQIQYNSTVVAENNTETLQSDYIGTKIKHMTISDCTYMNFLKITVEIKSSSNDNYNVIIKDGSGNVLNSALEEFGTSYETYYYEIDVSTKTGSLELQIWSYHNSFAGRDITVKTYNAKQPEYLFIRSEGVM